MNTPSGGIFGRETIAAGDDHVLVKTEDAFGRPEVTSETSSSRREARAVESAMETIARTPQKGLRSSCTTLAVRLGLCSQGQEAEAVRSRSGRAVRAL